MNNHYYIPQEPLVKNVIQSVWQVDYLTSFKTEYIIPKGIVEIIFNFSDNAPIIGDTDSNKALPHCFINGYNTNPIQLQLPKKQVFFGVLFQPLAIKKVFGSPAAEFFNSVVDLTLIDSSYHSLWHQLAEQTDFDARVSIIIAWIKQNYIELLPQEQLINRFLYTDNQVGTSVKNLADTLFYSPRHLSRKIIEATGMNTEEILLYKKYLHALDLMHHTDLPLTTIAYQSQFADQSHFIKAFKGYTKMTPRAYKRNKSFVKGHLYKDVR